MSGYEAETRSECAHCEALAALEHEFPVAHAAELRRFLKKVRFDLVTARANYAAHLQWRRVTSPEVLDPRSAAAIAKVPRWVWFEGGAGDGGVGSNDTRTVWVQGAMFDSDVASADDYVLATTRVLDANLDRASEERTVVTLSTHPHGAHPQTRKHIGVRARARSLSYTKTHTSRWS